jgi:hypothetical protein
VVSNHLQARFENSDSILMNGIQSCLEQLILQLAYFYASATTWPDVVFFWRVPSTLLPKLGVIATSTSSRSLHTFNGVKGAITLVICVFPLYIYKEKKRRTLK